MSASDAMFPSLRTALMLDNLEHLVSPGSTDNNFASGLSSENSSGSLTPLGANDQRLTFDQNFNHDPRLTSALQVMASPPSALNTFPDTSGHQPQEYKRKHSLDSTDSSTKRSRSRADDISIEELREKNEARYVSSH